MLINLQERATQAQVAMLVGVSQQAISAMIKEGKLPFDGVLLGDVLVSYCERLREQAAGRLGDGGLGGLDLVQERAALAREQRLGLEIKNAVLRGEFAPIVLLSEVLATASQSVVERFEQLPGQLKKSCPDLPDAARDVVMVALASARNEWVRATSALAVANAEADMGDDAELLDV